MDKTTRVLLLYAKLIQGEKINKLSFCMETDSLPRTFDRDIEDIRLYLSELFCNEELIYDRQENIYYLSGAERKTLETMEYLLIERVLLDTGVLRTDEMDGLLTHLASNVEDASKMKFREKDCIDQYEEPLHKKAILKMHGDLIIMITNQFVIKMKYTKMNGDIVEREVIPCIIKYDLGYLYLVAFLYPSDKPHPAYFRLDRIYSFSVIRKQKIEETQCVADYVKSAAKGIVQMYGGRFIEVLLSCEKEFYPYVHDKFRNLDIVQDEGDIVKIKVHVFEDGFIKWMMSQPVDLIHIIEPKSLQEKMVKEANELLKTYMEVQRNGKED